MDLFNKYCWAPAMGQALCQVFAENRTYESDPSSALEELPVQEGEGPEHKQGKSTSHAATWVDAVLVMSSEEAKVCFNQIPQP